MLRSFSKTEETLTDWSVLEKCLPGVSILYRPHKAGSVDRTLQAVCSLVRRYSLAAQYGQEQDECDYTKANVSPRNPLMIGVRQGEHE